MAKDLDQVFDADIERLQAAGAGAFLIGESLMREADIEAKLRQLLGNP